MTIEQLKPYYRKIKEDKAGFINEMYNDMAGFQELKKAILSNPNMAQTILFELGNEYDPNAVWVPSTKNDVDGNGNVVGSVTGIGSRIGTVNHVGYDEETSYVTFLTQYMDADKYAEDHLVKRDIDSVRVPEEVKYALTDMTFQGGQNMLNEFPSMLNALEGGHYGDMSGELKFKNRTNPMAVDKKGNKTYMVESDWWTGTSGHLWGDTPRKPGNITRVDSSGNALLNKHGNIVTQDYTKNRAHYHFNKIKQLNLTHYQNLPTTFSNQIP